MRGSEREEREGEGERERRSNRNEECRCNLVNPNCKPLAAVLKSCVEGRAAQGVVLYGVLI